MGDICICFKCFPQVTKTNCSFGNLNVFSGLMACKRLWDFGTFKQAKQSQKTEDVLSSTKLLGDHITFVFALLYFLLSWQEKVHYKYILYLLGDWKSYLANWIRNAGLCLFYSYSYFILFFFLFLFLFVFVFVLNTPLVSSSVHKSSERILRESRII